MFPMRIFQGAYAEVPPPNEELPIIDEAISSSLRSLDDLLKNRKEGLSPAETREAVNGIIQLLERKIILTAETESDQAQKNREKIEALINFNRKLATMESVDPEVLDELKEICDTIQTIPAGIAA